MNSSSLSSNPNNTTLLSLNSSTNQICCSHQTQYQALYRQLSTLRIQYRSLKHQNAALRNTTRGLQEQNGLFKQFLNNKKEMVNKLNNELENSQREIDRLEDQLERKTQEIIEFQQKNKQNKEEFKRMKEDLEKKKAKESDCQRKFQQLEIEIVKVKQEYEKRIQECQRDKTEQVSRITRSLENAISSILQQSHFSCQQRKIQSPQKIKNTNFQRTIQRKDQTTTLSNATNSILQTPASNPLVISNQLTTLITNYKQQQSQLKKQLCQKQETIHNLQNSINSLQSQVSSSLQLLRQQSDQIDTLRKKNQQIQEQYQKVHSKIQENSKGRDRIKDNVVNSMAKIIRQCVTESSQVLDKILAIAYYEENVQKNGSQRQKQKEGSSKTFQCEILIHQLQKIATNTHSQSLKISLHSHQLQRLTLDYQQLKQNYQLLTLKFNTLQREYQHVIEDNNRLIKYNSLSKYRISRNVKQAGIGMMNSRGESRGETPKERKGLARYWEYSKENIESNNYDLSTNL